jgi:hypothetical protein
MHIGHHDKVPVHTQSLPSVQRSRTCAVLPWPTYQEPNYSLGGQCANRLSLWDTSSRPPTLVGQTTGCLSATVVYHERMSLYSGTSSPSLKRWDSLPHEVENNTNNKRKPTNLLAFSLFANLLYSNRLSAIQPTQTIQYCYSRTLLVSAVAISAPIAAT